jgi:hypothetical protein
MTDRASASLRTERLFLFAFVPAVIFLLVSFYVRMNSNPDPLWTEFATPLLLAMVGARAIAVPSATATRKTSRAIGILLIVLSAILLFLAIRNSQGA